MSEFGEEIALLVGDGLIGAAFETIARETQHAPRLTGLWWPPSPRRFGSPYGLVAGQAWKANPTSTSPITIGPRHRPCSPARCRPAHCHPTGNPQDWFGLADALGAAYQVADDLYDAIDETGSMGKPAGQDTRNGKPNIVIAMGLAGALDHLRGLVDQAAASVPDCRGAEMLKGMIRKEATRLMPKKLAASAA